MSRRTSISRICSNTITSKRTDITVIRIHWNITLMSMATDGIAQEVCTLHPVEQWSQREFSNKAHLLDEDRADELTETLSKQGYTVRVEQP